PPVMEASPVMYDAEGGHVAVAMPTVPSGAASAPHAPLAPSTSSTQGVDVHHLASRTASRQGLLGPGRSVHEDESIVAHHPLQSPILGMLPEYRSVDASRSGMLFSLLGSLVKFFVPDFLRSLSMEREVYEEFLHKLAETELRRVGRYMRGMEVTLIAYGAICFSIMPPDKLSSATLVTAFLFIAYSAVQIFLRSLRSRFRTLFFNRVYYASIVAAERLMATYLLLHWQQSAQFPHTHVTTNFVALPPGSVNCGKALAPIMMFNLAASSFVILPASVEALVQAGVLIISFASLGVWINVLGVECVDARTNNGLPELSTAIAAHVLLSIMCILSAYTRRADEKRKFVVKRALEETNERHRKVLENLYPAQIVDDLVHHRHPRSRLHKRVAILWCDLVGFTALAQTRAPGEVFDLLNKIYSTFDDLLERHGLWKADTVGDAYIAVAGLFRHKQHGEGAARARSRSAQDG
ncbi:hypothetical protein EON62_04370, partial [archaeon]